MSKIERPVVIGICGRSGSGKSYVSELFASYGGEHVDTDAVYHALLEPKRGRISACAAAIASEFGDEIIKDKTVDRNKLASIVFSDPEKLSVLNSVAHKYIKNETRKIIRNTDAPFVLIDAPVLFESGFDRLCDFTVCVTASDEVSIKRIMRRDGIGDHEARLRLGSQKSNGELEERCDFTVINDPGSKVEERVRQILIEKGLIENDS